MRAGLVLLTLAALAAAEPKASAARVEFFLRNKPGIKKDRFVAAMAQALDKEGLDLKKLPYDYAKFNGGSFWYYQWHFWIHKSPRPRFKDAKKVAEETPGDTARLAILGHKAWLALEASSTDHVARDYSVLCRIAAELLGDDVLAIHFPARKAWVAGDSKGLKQKLRAKDPLKALGICLTAEEQSKAEMARVQAKAVDEARTRFGEFKQAFRRREKTGATTFAVAFRALGGKEESISVKEIRGTRIKGFMLSKNMADWDKTVHEYQILDWSYRVGRTNHGNFRLRAAQAHMKKKLGK